MNVTPEGLRELADANRDPNLHDEANEAREAADFFEFCDHVWEQLGQPPWTNEQRTLALFLLGEKLGKVE